MRDILTIFVYFLVREIKYYVLPSILIELNFDLKP
jgi:hypothetical protein